MILHKFLNQGAVIALPGEKLLIGFGPWKRSALPSSEAPSFFVTDFFLNQKEPWMTFQEHAVLEPQELLYMLGNPIPPVQPRVQTWSSPFKPLFQSTFNDLKQRSFATGMLQKAVPYVYAISPTPPNLPFSLFSALKQISTGMPLYLYGIWSKSQGMLGLTPEYLFQQVPGKLRTVALAGTGTPENVWNEKNKREHEIVIDWISEALTPFGKLSIESTKQVDYSILSHLSTSICLEAELSFQQAVQALHPTPALGAAPLSVGRYWLKGYDRQLPRFYYGSPFGYSIEGQGNAYVAIRNMQWSKVGTYIAAGCGVVPESDLETEWQEIEIKLRSIKQGLGL